MMGAPSGLRTDVPLPGKTSQLASVLARPLPLGVSKTREGRSEGILANVSGGARIQNQASSFYTSFSSSSAIAGWRVWALLLSCDVTSGDSITLLS